MGTVDDFFEGYHPGRFAHHLELWSAEESDDQVRNWLGESWLVIA